MSARAAASIAPRDEAPRPTLVQRIRAWLIGLAAWLVGILPERLAIALADLAGRLWYRATPERAALARRQLRRICLHLTERGDAPTRLRAAATSERSLESLVRATYVHAARYYLEVMRTGRINARFLRERLLVETPEVVEEAFSHDGPVIFVGMHFGAIELPALYLAERTGRRVVGPMETINDPALQAWFVRSRARVGVRIVGLREARRELLGALRAGESVGLVGDRDISGGGIETELFGHPARLPMGPALLAVESGAPLYVAAVRRAGPGRYRGRLTRVHVAAEGTRRERTQVTVTRLARAFEAGITDAPEQWWAVFFPIWSDLATADRTEAAPADDAAGPAPAT